MCFCIKYETYKIANHCYSQDTSIEASKHYQKSKVTCFFYQIPSKSPSSMILNNSSRTVYAAQRFIADLPANSATQAMFSPDSWLQPNWLWLPSIFRPQPFIRQCSDKLVSCITLNNLQLLLRNAFQNSPPPVILLINI